MLRLVVRRAWVQRRLLSAIVLLVVVATTLMGFYALLLGVTGPRAFSEQVQRSQPEDVAVTAYVVGLAGSDLEAARQDARAVVQGVLAPLHPSLVSTATSQMRQVGDSGRFAYLATTDAPAGRGVLSTGRWPRAVRQGPAETVVPDAAARAWGLRIGDRLTLGPGRGLGDNHSTATVVVVGTYRGLPRASATSDPLSGAGFETAYTISGVTAPAAGPFLVDDATFRATGFDVTGLRVDGQPDLSTADDASLRASAQALDGAYHQLSSRVGSAAEVTRVASSLPETLDRLHTQRTTTRSALLVALVLDTMLGLAALVLAGRLLADTRAGELELMTTLGLGRRQQVASALTESGLLALVSAAVAVPAAAAAHAAVTHLPTLRSAELAESPTITPALVVTVLAGAAILTLVLVVSPLLGRTTGRAPGRRRAWARSGIDVLLLLVAIAAWSQLSSRPATDSGSDALLVLAPAVCLAAVTLVAVRCLPPLFALAAAVGSRSRSLMPVSLNPPALRVGAGTALVLLSLAAASAAFGVAAHATWDRSQSDQADLLVGTDLSFVLDDPPTAVDAAHIERTARGTGPGAEHSLVSPVVALPVPLGNFFGARGEPPRLVALDTQHAGSLLRGRAPSGTTWSDVGDQLTPSDRVRGVPLPAGGAGVTIVGRTRPDAHLVVTPTLVVQDAGGFRSTLEAAPLPVDGRSHPLRWSAPPTPGQAVVAVQLAYADAGSSQTGTDDLPVSVALRVPGHRANRAADWPTRLLSSSGVVIDSSTAAHPAAGATVVRTDSTLLLSFLLYEEAHVIATDFDPPPTVPVAVSQPLADAAGTTVGGDLSATVGSTAVQLLVTDIVPTIPSAPGQVAVLADVDTMSRALIAAGDLEPAVNAFWVSRPAAGTADALSGLGLGEVTTRDDVASALTGGPMRVPLPVAYLTVAGSAVLLLIAGAVLVVSADQRRRTGEVARLRALGLSRPGARRLVFAQHSALLGALVLSGVLVGAAAAVALSRALVRSDEGAAPVPPATLAWPWVAETLLACGLLVACLVIAAVAAAVQVEASDTTRLREVE